MGAITPDKKLYDQYAVEYFQSLGWKAFAIGITGRYADVLAVRGNTLAVVEVKSPNETSAVRSYDDSAHLSGRLHAQIGDYLLTARDKVFGLFGRGQSMEQLYAVTVTSQIFRYVHEFEEKAREYEKASGGIKLVGTRFEYIPYLVIPSEQALKAKSAFEVIKRHGYISSYSTDMTQDICVMEFRY